ncbi:hypothetical protein [Bacillus salipaludis]|uniref:Uncharacterized protein n=1 Tax=Bacillus salipaludis TaxID=2547811 RepID=A0ABW8REL4_9BACI
MDQKMNKWLDNPVYFRWGFFIPLLVSAGLHNYQIEQNHLYVFYILTTVFLGISFYKKPTWFLFIFTTVVVICRLLRHQPLLKSISIFFTYQSAYYFGKLRSK